MSHVADLEWAVEEEAEVDLLVEQHPVAFLVVPPAATCDSEKCCSVLEEELVQADEDHVAFVVAGVVFEHGSVHVVGLRFVVELILAESELVELEVVVVALQLVVELAPVAFVVVGMTLLLVQTNFLANLETPSIVDVKDQDEQVLVAIDFDVALDFDA